MYSVIPCLLKFWFLARLIEFFFHVIVSFLVFGTRDVSVFNWIGSYSSSIFYNSTFFTSFCFYVSTFGRLLLRFIFQGHSSLLVRFCRPSHGCVCSCKKADSLSFLVIMFRGPVVGSAKTKCNCFYRLFFNLLFRRLYFFSLILLFVSLCDIFILCFNVAVFFHPIHHRLYHTFFFIQISVLVCFCSGLRWCSC